MFDRYGREYFVRDLDKRREAINTIEKFQSLKNEGNMSGTPEERELDEGVPASLPPDIVQQSLEMIVESLEKDKAEDIVVINLTKRVSFTDHMVIATGLVHRQINAMAQHIKRKLRNIGVQRVLIEGVNGSDWVLLDTGNIVVHLFKAETRSLYNLEKMWEEPP